MRQLMTTLRKRIGISYGEEVPLDRSTLVDWCISRLELWATSAGMETFKDEVRDGHMTVVLGGKVLVVDIDLSVSRSDPSNPVLGVVNVKTSYAVPNGAASSTTEGSDSLDGFLADSLTAYLAEVYKEENARDALEAERLANEFSRHLKYLMKLDQLALREGDSGLRWFNNIDHLARQVLERLATVEAEVISSYVFKSFMNSHFVPLTNSWYCLEHLVHRRSLWTSS